MRSVPFPMLALLLAACAAVGPQSSAPPLATATRSLISRGQAIDIALKIVSPSRPETSAALVTPANIQAQQMTLEEALRRMQSGGSGSGYSPSMPVWYVTMDGLWENEMPAPGVTVTPGYLHHAAEIIDAVTGMEIASSLRP